MTKYRCLKCGKIFLETEGDCEVESICPECGEKILRENKVNLGGLKE